jgi:glycosyltransferase involved in cell wall biosynthesis
MRKRRLLTIGHSYCVRRNRELAHAFARLGAADWEVTVVAPQRLHADGATLTLRTSADEPCRVIGVPVRLSAHPQVMWYGSALTRILAEPWDLIHCWQEPFVVAAAQVARGAARQSRIVFATFQNLPRAYPWPFAAMESAALRRASGWLAYGETVLEALRDRPGYRDRPHRFIPPAVSLDAFRPDAEARRRTREALGWAASDVPVVGFVGRWVPEKGLDTLMAALDRVTVPWRALIVGQGPLERQVRAWADVKGDRVRLRTDAAHDDVPALMAAMDVLCVPSRTTARWREQFGRVMVEAFATGVPVVGSDSGEIPRVLRGVGEVAGEGNEAAWAAALTRLLTDASLQAAMASAGIERARTRYATDVVAAQHLDFFAARCEEPA